MKDFIFFMYLFTPNIAWPNQSDGKENNGGFDLDTNPTDIDKITEFKNFPHLKKYIEWIRDSRCYKSYGCDGGWDDGKFFAYIEFSFKKQELAKNRELYQKLFDDFELYSIRKFSPDIAASIVQSLCPEMAEFWLRETGDVFGYKIALWFRAQNPEFADKLIGIFFDFLKLRDFS